MKFRLTALTILPLAMWAISCAPSEPPPSPQQQLLATMPAFQAGLTVQEIVAQHDADGLPVVDEDKVAEIYDLLDAITVGGSIGNRAQRSLADMEQAIRTSALLGLVEQRLTPVPIQQMAYSWLRDTGSEGMMPRLTLRLKYEKDSWSVVCIAHTLLRLNNGCGLQALINVLSAEQGDQDLEAARTYSASILTELPGAGTEFAANWELLLQINDLWGRQRRLTAADDDPKECGAELKAEYWRMIGKLISQRLRPVDDARFVLLRQRGFVIPLLVQASRDPDRYVREHALQTLSWIGHPIGHWSVRHDLDFVAEVLPTVTDRLCRTRALDALGAAGLASATEPLWAWVQSGSREAQTAAADALLRCAAEDALGEGRSLTSELTAFLQSPAGKKVGPEAAFSLYALWMDLQPDLEAEYPIEVWEALPETERQRRQRWAEERATRQS